jgi:hypothetical protein
VLNEGLWSGRFLRMARRCVLAVALVLAWSVSASCERQAARPGNDTTVPVAPPPDSTPAPPVVVAPAWDSSAGPALLVLGPSSQDASLIVPSFTESANLDTAAFNTRSYVGNTVELLARGRSIGTATIADVGTPKPEAGCTTWPVARLTPSTPGSAIPPWTVGFTAGRAQQIVVDSIETLSRADSGRFAAEIARLASALPNDTAAALRGLPFVVRTMRRFSSEPGTETIVAEVMRRLNEEANPRSEQILLVAERDSAAGGRFEAAYFERASGAEESVETVDLLGVVRLGAARRLTLVLVREFGEGVRYSLLEDVGPRRWRVRWTSAYAGC